MNARHSHITADQWQAVNEFWFNELTPMQWFVSTAELDKTISDKFSPLLQQFAEQKHIPPANRETLAASNLTSANEILAAILVVDQFSRNIYRGDSKAFASDATALALATYLVETPEFSAMSVPEKQFGAMPFMHDESLSSQTKCVELFKEFAVEKAIESAEEHRDIILKFGRFPHRNKVLGRESTEQELDYLENGKSFGQG